MFEAILFIITVHLYGGENKDSAVLITSFAMGLQNALFTNFSGAVVRTTDVTGLMTDIGLIIGHYVRGKEET